MCIRDREWIGPQGEYLRIAGDSAFISVPFHDQRSLVHFNDTMLTLTATALNPHLQPYTYVDSYRIERLNEDTLVLRAIDSSAYEYMKTWEADTFVNLAHLYEGTFFFENVYFARSGMAVMVGDYSNVEFEIDSSGSMLFSCTRAKGKLNGTYKSHLNRLQLVQLNELIKRSAPDRLAFPRERWSDGPGYKFRFYYNNKTVEAGGHGMSHLAWPLVGFMYSLIDKMPFEKISDKFGLND